MRRKDDDLRDELSGVPYTEHPLFPLEDGQKPFDVSYIQIARKEGGAMVWVPQAFKAEELTTTDAILERFGGGTYELYARASSRTNLGQMGNISKRRLLTLPGRPKPLDPSNATAQEEIAAGLRPNPFDAKPAATGVMGDSGVLVAILQMNQQAAERSAQQSMQFMTMFMQMMQSSKQESAQMMQTMMTAMTQMTSSQQSSMMQMIPLMVGSRGGGPEEIAKYAELFKSLGFGKSGNEGNDETPENESVGAILENVADIVAGAPAALGALKGLSPGLPPNGAPPAEGPPVQHPPGSAASVIAGNG